MVLVGFGSRSCPSVNPASLDPPPDSLAATHTQSTFQPTNPSEAAFAFTVFCGMLKVRLEHQ